MGFGDLALAGDSEQGEKHNHRTAAGGKPEGAGDTVVVAGERGAEQGSGPEPGLGFLCQRKGAG